MSGLRISPTGSQRPINLRRYTATVGDGVATSFVVTHGLGTRAITVAAWKLSEPYSQLTATCTANTGNAVTVGISPAPASGGALVVVIG